MTLSCFIGTCWFVDWFMNRFCEMFKFMLLATHETEIKIQTKRLTLVFEISKKMCVVESRHKIIWMWCLSKTMVIFLKNVSMLSKQKPFLFTVYLVYSSYGYLRWSIQGDIKPMWFFDIFSCLFYIFSLHNGGVITVCSGFLITGMCHIKSSLGWSELENQS